MAFLSVAMPHYNKANNKHDNISTSKPLLGKFEYFCTPVFIHNPCNNYYKIALWHALYCMHRAKFVTAKNITYLDLERERDLEREADLDLE